MENEYNIKYMNDEITTMVESFYIALDTLHFKGDNRHYAEILEIITRLEDAQRRIQFIRKNKNKEALVNNAICGI